jgi:hypothetical protein
MSTLDESAISTMAQHEPEAKKFTPTLENVRAFYARQHIPDVLELGPMASVGGYYFVVERDAPEICKQRVNEMCPESVGTPYNNLLLAVDDDSMVLRFHWTRDMVQTPEVPQPIADLTETATETETKTETAVVATLTLEEVREYFASSGRGMGIEPDNIVALGPETKPGIYPILLNSMEAWHVLRVRARLPDLPEGYNNELMIRDGLMAIRFTC